MRDNLHPFSRTTCACLIALLFGTIHLHAQITFRASDLPSLPGKFAQAYITTGANPATLIGVGGGPQLWDFSQAPQSGDFIRRMDVVATTDGGQQNSFPSATYAERYTDNINAQEWDYYSLATNSGRRYYGSYVPATVTNTFSPPATDIPATVGYGTNWSYVFSTTFSTITEESTVSATVDAYGTISLPQLGSFQTLRVNQTTTTREYYGSILFDTHYIREYYWLMPGLDKAVHIVSAVSSTPPPANFTDAHEIRRVFAASSLTNAPSPVGGLRIKTQSGLAILNWLAVTNVATYQVQSLGNIAKTNWQLVASPATNSWSESLTATQRFYRVFY